MPLGRTLKQQLRTRGPDVWVLMLRGVWERRLLPAAVVTAAALGPAPTLARTPGTHLCWGCWLGSWRAVPRVGAPLLSTLRATAFQESGVEAAMWPGDEAPRYVTILGVCVRVTRVWLRANILETNV